LPPVLKPIASIFWVGISDQIWLRISWCIILSWLLYFHQDFSLYQGQGAQRVASAYGWVTIVILSMVKRAHSNILHFKALYNMCIRQKSITIFHIQLSVKLLFTSQALEFCSFLLLLCILSHGILLLCFCILFLDLTCHL